MGKGKGKKKPRKEGEAEGGQDSGSGQQIPELMQGLRVGHGPPEQEPRSSGPRVAHGPSGQEPRGSGPRDETRGAGPRGEGRGAGFRGEGRGAGPRDDTRGAGPRGDERRAGPRDETRGSGPRDETRGAGSRGEGRGAGPRGDERRAGPRDDTRGAGPRDETRGAGPRGDERGAGPRGEGRGVGFRGEGRGAGFRGEGRGAGFRGEGRGEDRGPPKDRRLACDERPQQQVQSGPPPGMSSSGPAGAWVQRGQQPSHQGPPSGMPKPASAPFTWGPKKQQQQPQQQKPQSAGHEQRGSGQIQEPSGQQQRRTAPTQETRSDSRATPSDGAKKQTFTPKLELSVTGVDVKKMTDEEKNLWISRIPERKNPQIAGKLGRPIRVRTNMMEIIFDKNFKVSATHYDIKFDPDKPKFLKRPAFNKARSIHFPNNWPAFDGRANVYSAGLLPFDDKLETTVEVLVDQESGETRNVKVMFEKVNVIDISWLKNVRPGLKEHEKNKMSMQVLDVVLRCASYDRAVAVGRSFFQRPRNAVDLGTGMELWTGLFQSAVLGWKPYFNVDVAHKSFPKPQPVIDAIKDICSFGGRSTNVTPELVEDNFNKIEGYLKSLKITYQLPNRPSTKRTFVVNGLARSPREYTFTLANDEVTNVLAYYSGSKNYNIQYPNLPCLWVGNRNKEPRIVLPIELCRIADENVTNRKLDDYQTRSMIKEAATPPYIREQKIMEAFQGMTFNSNPTMREFGINITGKFTEVDARVLEAPTLRDEKQIKVNKGVWNANQFFKAEKIEEKRWTILNLSKIQDRVLNAFVEELKRNSNGMQIGEPHKPFESVQLRANDIRPLIDYLERMKNKGLRLVVVVIPGRFADVYPKVKQVAELKVGILTQCIKDFTMERKMNRMTAGNILLKLNSKLNGVNHIIDQSNKPDCLKVPCMFIGADVTHPSPDARDIPSIAAVAASFDETAFKYNVAIKLQPPRQEIISDLTEIVYNQIRRFMDINSNLKPVKIIYYRDGVSEGQFPQIMHFELQAIRNACRKIGGPERYEPKITFLVVQKRHHIRLFPTDRKNSDDRGGNVQAGTVVDTEITHPSHIDFYLVSHASIQGTAKPTKYRCLWDDNDMSEDDIEKLTYYLCHMFSRCTRSVSYPAPTYYAHLAAFRARALIHNVRIQLNNLPHEQRNKLTLREDFHNNNPMFFV